MSVVSKKVTATGEVAAGRGKVLGIWIETSGTGGTLILKDGGASGESRLDIDTASLAGNYYLPIPGGGIHFGTDIHATLTSITSITVIYENN